MIVRSDIFNNTYSGSACRKVPDIVVPIGRLSILEQKIIFKNKICRAVSLFVVWIFGLHKMREVKLVLHAELSVLHDRTFCST
jgi:hypothetical protein